MSKEVLTERFLTRLNKDLVDCGVYLYLHPDPEVVIRAAAKTLPMDQVNRLALVVPSVGTAAVRYLCEELHQRWQDEADPSVSGNIEVLLMLLLGNNDDVAEHVFSEAVGIRAAA